MRKSAPRQIIIQSIIEIWTAIEEGCIIVKMAVLVILVLIILLPVTIIILICRGEMREKEKAERDAKHTWKLNR
jgi:heme/copper-type cytochrome/quinol oxidase subunit 2